MKLYHKANQRKDQYLKKKSCSFSLIFSDGRTPFIYNTFVKNGHKTENMQVYLLTCGDGKQQIIKAARCFCTDAKNNPALLENFHAKNFEKYLKGMINIPDPEMILLFGERRGLIGYLPWHIRLSEIIFHPTHHNMHFKEFQEVLLRYSKCEQRLGK
ncbi:dehydrodolichyl diphosphate synthase complex subunit nus1-like [Uloborus diversus]|uniref:dehydrodolichyl diphosphate synthase complex subunit nus1-like n=1 Tax=Uloborus diversus TaxID=327109 RepID=UPI00240A030C|nr:dehydrodolichyl diphosphate synthase complex subunit nus1-like [Uloborus diversus]